MFVFRRSGKTMSDTELILQYRESDNLTAIEILFERYHHMIYLVCYDYMENHEDARDAVMEIFHKLIIELKQREIKQFNNWLFTLSKNYCLNLKRSQKRYCSLEEETTQYLSALPVAEATSIHEKEGLLQLLENALSRIKPAQKICIDLFYLNQKSYREIASHTGLELCEIKSHIQNGKRNLRNKYLELLEVRDG